MPRAARPKPGTERMLVYLNGSFVDERLAMVSIRDRGFLYGDGLFETLRCYSGEPFLWEEHLARLSHGLDVLQILPPVSLDALRGLSLELLRLNALTEAILRITITRGPGERGYSPARSGPPTLCLSAQPFVPRAGGDLQVIVSRLRLATPDPLAGLKHLGKLAQVLARAEADQLGAHEALLLDTDGCVLEGTSANLFWVEGQTLFTPPLQGILPGITRAHLLRLASQLNLRTVESRVRVDGLQKAEGVFLTSSVLEIATVATLDGRPLARSPLVEKLRDHYRHPTTHFTPASP